MGLLISIVVIVFIVGVILTELKVKLPKLTISWSKPINYLLLMLPIIGFIIGVLIINELEEKDTLKNTGISRDPIGEILLIFMSQAIGFILLLILLK